MSTSKKTISLKNLKPASGYLLIEPAQTESQTASGIYLPDNQEKPQYGTVLAVGDDLLTDGQKITAPAKVGDLVIYKKWGGNEVKIEDIEYQFLKFDDLLAVIK